MTNTSERSYLPPGGLYDRMVKRARAGIEPVIDLAETRGGWHTPAMEL